MLLPARNASQSIDNIGAQSYFADLFALSFLDFADEQFCLLVVVFWPPVLKKEPAGSAGFF